MIDVAEHTPSQPLLIELDKENTIICSGYDSARSPLKGIIFRMDQIERQNWPSERYSYSAILSSPDSGRDDKSIDESAVRLVSCFPT